jgi:hypothetical protein
MMIVNNNENSKAFNLIKVNELSFKGEQDGNVLLIEKENKKPKVKRFDNTKEAIDNMLSEIKDKGVYGIHTRTATSGNLTKSNFHFWQKEGFYFAHNGIVSVLDKMATKKSDSRLFFDFLMRDIKEKERKLKNKKKKKDFKLSPTKVLKKIEENAEKFEFYGVAFLYDSRERILYLIGSRAIDVVSDSENFIAFASFEPKVCFSQAIDYSGFTFTRENTPLLLDKLDLSSGYYAYSIDRQEIIAERERSYFGFATSGQSSSGWQEREIETEYNSKKWSLGGL